MLINFLQKAKPHTVAIQILQESLRLFKNFSLAQHIAKLLNKKSGKKTFSRSVKNSWAGNRVKVCKECTVHCSTNVKHC